GSAAYEPPAAPIVPCGPHPPTAPGSAGGSFGHVASQGPLNSETPGRAGGCVSALLDAVLELMIDGSAARCVRIAGELHEHNITVAIAMRTYRHHVGRSSD